MSEDIISLSLRNKFRDAMAQLSWKEIEALFELGGLKPVTDYRPKNISLKRALIEQYYASIHFDCLEEVNKLIYVYEEFLLKLKCAPSNKILPFLIASLEKEGFIYTKQKIILSSTSSLDSVKLSLLDKGLVQEEFKKVRINIESCHYPTAITNAYTLVEAVLKELLRICNISFNEDEGDIRQLYKLVSEALKLEPQGDHLENHLKMILQGLKHQISGLYQLANKGSDRHARRYNPQPHHARLAVNASITLTEFLIDSYEYQSNKTVADTSVQRLEVSL
ncbi:MAG: abortive infection family protein [Vampirovibrionales bacterium]|nr:abortive infection family protein [Vampirovibrionales bacterium]